MIDICLNMKQELLTRVIAAEKLNEWTKKERTYKAIQKERAKDLKRDTKVTFWSKLEDMYCIVVVYEDYSHTDIFLECKSLCISIKNVNPSESVNNQNGFCKHRYMAYYLFCLLKATNLMKFRNINARIFFLDYRNAFNTVLHAMVYNMLVTIGASPHFIDIIKNLYEDICIKVRTNGVESDKFCINALLLHWGHPEFIALRDFHQSDDQGRRRGCQLL